MLKNNKGFSLIELMVVVAIIAILASFAIPQYQNFQSKARQKESNVLLSGYYMAAVATHSELAGYPGNLVGTGYNPTGQLHYRITVVDGATDPTSGPNDNSCVDTSVNCTFAENYGEITTGTFRVDTATNGACTPTLPDPDHFRACATGIIDTSAGTDGWYVDDKKIFFNTHSGID